MAEAEYEAAAVGLSLDRMEIEEAGPNPEGLAAAIHGQLGEAAGPVPVRAIAAALDILEIRAQPLGGLEGALVAEPERGEGMILVNGRSSTRRQRFTIGHELGHYLDLRHEPSGDRGFPCSAQDMRLSAAVGARSLTRQERQEIQANVFAIELLTPRARLRPYLSLAPALTHSLKLARDFDVSREAAVRRYVSLHDADLAVVFSRSGRVTYFYRGRGFPQLNLGKNSQIPWLPRPSSSRPLSDLEEADPADWVRSQGRVMLRVQTLHQQCGYATTLLVAEPTEDDDDVGGGVEDAYSRFTRFGR